jgi:acetolactate synthase-1/2/3 large subunit
VRIADVVVETLSQLGISDVFTVTGGAAMHLNDAFGQSENISCHYLHHEQSCAMAAEGYARIKWKPAAVCVTAGPGAINAMNGVFGAFTDSIPMFVVSGQSRSDTLLTAAGMPQGLRQMGDQEVNTEVMVSPITKKFHQLSLDDDVQAVVLDLFAVAVQGRPGPVWLEIPVDVQGMRVDESRLRSLEPIRLVDLTKEMAHESTVQTIVDEISAANRPVILAGTGVRVASVIEELQLFAETANIPVLTAWTHDVFPSDHVLYAGRPGTIGTRPGNFVLQAADLVIVLGSRLNIRQVSYNWLDFARDARIIHVDIDEAELAKPHLNQRPGLKVKADLRQLMPELLKVSNDVSKPRQSWLTWISKVRLELEPKWSDYPERLDGINPYHFVMSLSDSLDGSDVIVSGDATACIVPFQVLQLPAGRRLFSNSGCASMGYDLPAALGASVACAPGRVICLAGDGSVMMNLQELQSLKTSGLNIAVFVLVNNGYLSIKQTQSNFFGRSFGSSKDSGISFPDFARVAGAFGLLTIELFQQEAWQDSLTAFLSAQIPRVCVVHLDEVQEFEPRIRSRMTSSGIVTPPMDDMYPHMDEEKLTIVRAEGRLMTEGEKVR